VPGRKVQELTGSSRLLAMFPRHVFNSRRGHSDIDMPRLFASLQLSSRELDVHLRGGLVGECRELHGVR
jgi:hypothetical protein